MRPALDSPRTEQRNGHSAASSNSAGRTSTEWAEVEECPVCHHRGWCRISDDRTIVNCRRESAGGEPRQYSDGSTYYVHRLSGGNGDHREAQVARPTVAKLADPTDPADPNTLHEVYSEFLSDLRLEPSHRKNLKGRGFPDAEIDRLGYRSWVKYDDLVRRLHERHGKRLLSVPGFAVNDRGKPTFCCFAGLLIPVRDIQGRIIALKSRPDAPKKDGPKYLWITSKKRGGPSPGAPAHIPLGIAGPIEAVRITEGELKADLATALSGIPTVSAPGVASWKPALAAAMAIGCKAVRIAFDTDMHEKQEVANAMLALADEVVRKGLELELDDWDPAHKGIDDALAAGEEIRVLSGEEADRALDAIRPQSGLNGHADGVWPALEPGKRVRATDQDNYGTVQEDLGDRARVRFESPSGQVATPILPKSILREPDGSPIGAGVVPESLAELSDADLGIRLASEIEDRPIEWLWPYRLASGEMALLAGDGGMGKSSLLLAIAAKISRGGEWWDGTPVPFGDTVIVSAEDDPATTIVPRLRALDAELSRITILSAVVKIKKPGKPPEIHPQTLQNRPYWQEVLRRRPEARLLIVDPLPSYLGGGVSDAKNNELRGVLEPFLELVTRPAGVCMLANTHLNKSIDAKTPVHRITGSIAYVNLPRNVHVVVPDSDNPSRRFFKQAKCNNAPDDLSALAFTMEKKLLPSARGEIETAIPRFEEGTVSVDLGHLMGGGNRRRGPKAAKSEKLAIWLFDYLSEQQSPVQAGPLYDQAAAAFADEVPNPLGEKGEDGRWTHGKALQRAADYIPNLPAPRNGKRVERFRDPDSQRWHWQLLGAESAF